MVSFGKPAKASSVTFRKATRGGGRRGSKYDSVIEAICELAVGQFISVSLEEGKSLPKFRAFWAQMLSSRVRPALIELEGVPNRVALSKDYEATFLEGVDDAIAIVCKENTYTQEDLDRDRDRTNKAQATRSANGKTGIEEDESDFDF